MRFLAALLLAALSTVPGTTVAQPAQPSSEGQAQGQTRPRNVVLFVADGLRAGMVSPELTPAMAGLMARGVRFANPHSLFPTFTTANASGMATGHQLGDTGNFSNYVYAGFPLPSAGGSRTPFLENDPVLGEMDEHYAGDYLNGGTVLKAAREAGLSTASIGKLGPALIFDHTERSGQRTVLVDDSTGRAGGIPLSDEVRARMEAAGLPVQAPTRGANGQSGAFNAPASATALPGTRVPNTEQQAWFVGVATRVVLPLFRERGKPFVLVYWSRDPDGTQHNQGDSPLRLVPGINGPASLAAIRNADDNLAALLAALREQGLEGDTDVILTADHGFSTISKESGTSFAASQAYQDVPPGHLPQGFVALDLAHALDLPLFDPDAKDARLAPGAHPSRGHGLIGADPAKPDVVVASNGGSDLVYVPNGDKALVRRVVEALAAQDYTSGLFVDDTLGPVPGTLPLSAIALQGSATTPRPSVVVNFRTFSTGCADATTCGVEVADTALLQGQGMHGSFSRADTRNAMGAAGPSFRQGFADPAPASNADLGLTIAHLLRLELPGRGGLPGRVLAEALQGATDEAVPQARQEVLRSEPDAAGRVTVLARQAVGEVRYFDAAGYPGRTLGLPPEEAR